MSRQALSDLNDDALASALSASRELVDAPEHVIQRAFATWRPRRQDKPASILSKIIASITFDSASASPLAFGVRGSAATGRQMLFSAEGRDIDLRLRPLSTDDAGQWELRGQIFGPDNGGTVILESGDRNWAVPLDDLSEFRFPAVPSGQYTMTLSLAGTIVVLPPLQVAHQA
jgi:hypothetical protein